MAPRCGPHARVPYPVALALTCGVLFASGCRARVEPAPRGAQAASQTSPSSAATNSCTPSVAEEPAPRPLRRCFSEHPPWVESSMPLLLDRAGEFLERNDHEGALACAEEAARQMPTSVEAHHDRAVALIRLGRLDEARDALALALAIRPTDPETLELAADFYVNHLPPTAERAAIGYELARRGAKVTPRRDRSRAARLALLEGQALIDLGRAGESLRPIETALRLAPQDAAARYERGVALFELCRFPDARQAFEQVLEVDAGHAHALYHLGLIAERDGQEDRAIDRFAEASRRDAKAFPATPDVSALEFKDRVKRIVAALPADVRADLSSIVLETAELPSVEDLTAELPPLSPTILGLFRGLPLGRDDAEEVPAASARARQARGVLGTTASGSPSQYVAPERAIVLYRRNILRSISRVEELDQAIERTLLHEVGHLRGEDDGSLRDRGLE